ncbi:MAG: hypothetical protein QGM48_10710, partial [Actinomycetota bacterium]|nr:hypothetical protein [Actinomycetota bacterium]
MTTSKSGFPDTTSLNSFPLPVATRGDEGIFEFGGIRRNPLPYQSRRIGLDSSGQRVPILVGAKLTGRT